MTLAAGEGLDGMVPLDVIGAGMLLAEGIDVELIVDRYG